MFISHYEAQDSKFIQDKSLMAELCVRNGYDIKLSLCAVSVLHFITLN